MRLILNLSALDRLVEAIEHVQRQGKTVEKVAVTQAEYEALMNCPIGSPNDPAARSYFKDHEMYVADVLVVVEPVPSPTAFLAEAVAIAPGITVQGA